MFIFLSYPVFTMFFLVVTKWWIFNLELGRFYVDLDRVKIFESYFIGSYEYYFKWVNLFLSIIFYNTLYIFGPFCKDETAIWNPFL